jgi:phenylalanyl-tRNA synthetase beta chain
MKVPISWIKDFVDIPLPLDDLAKLITMAGLEVEEIRIVGLPLPVGKIEGHRSGQQRQEIKVTGLEWDPEKIVVAAIYEVMPHPNADRLVLCRLDDGQQEHIILTGAPNLFPYKGTGTLQIPIKVAYAKEGAQIYDGHQPGQVLTTLTRAKIRGVDSYSMACSEKELGISDEHAGVIILDDTAPVGMSLAEYMGDAVFDIAITPNLARNANILGVAREIAALTRQSLRMPEMNPKMEGNPIQGRADIQIMNPDLNPRFVLGLIENVQIRPSPYEVQRRLRLAGMRPINNVVDATNFAMLELGEPLHAFDYDILEQRAGGKPPTILTRTAHPGERLTTLDGVEHDLNDFNVLVCDTAGALSIAGVMGGAESEVNSRTRNILLEGAAWNYINIRRTIASQRMSSEAAYRFSRGVHPAMAERGVRRCLVLMEQWTDGIVSKGLIDHYPLPPIDPTVEITPADAQRWLGVHFSVEQMADILRRLEFKVEISSQSLRVTVPDHRLDIGEGIIGVADLMEEIARIYGYDRIPTTRLADELPPQVANLEHELIENLRDILVNLGLQEVITYRLTSPDRERRRFPRNSSVPDERPYIRVNNPIASDRFALRQSLLASLLDIVERNARIRERMAIFEIGKVFLANEANRLPDEPLRLAIILTGAREQPSWQSADQEPMDFFDMKGLIEALCAGLHLRGVHFVPAEHHPSYHPGKSAHILIGTQQIGCFGEIHPLVRENYEFAQPPVLVAEINLDTIQTLVPERFTIQPLPIFPPVLEDLAIVVEESIPAEQVARVILQAGGDIVTQVHLFDVYRGGQAGAGLKSLAYRLTYQTNERTLTDSEVAQIRKRILQQLETELDAKLRS